MDLDPKIHIVNQRNWMYIVNIIEQLHFSFKFNIFIENIIL